MSDQLYIWIARWKDFQHYKPDPERGPKWIKDYTAQLDDMRYLALTDRQRALLRDLRDVFATYRGRLPYDTRTITRARHSQTRDADIKTLNQAGFLFIVSREGLEKLLSEFYRGSRAEVEVEVEKEQPVPAPEPEANYAADPNADIDFDRNGAGAGTDPEERERGLPRRDLERINPHAILETIE